MSPELLLFLVGFFCSSTMAQKLIWAGWRARNRRDPFLDCRDHCSAKSPTTTRSPNERY